MKIAVAGGSGSVGQELIDHLIATTKHEIVLLSRKDKPSDQDSNGPIWIKVDYNDTDSVVDALQDVHTLLCFFTSHTDPGNGSQKSLIDAAVKAGVKRYAPSEWASAKFDHIPWYALKLEIREYLANLNKDKKALEYTLFHPGIFTNYFAAPYKTTTHINAFQSHIDFNNRQAIVVDGGDEARLSLITAKDFCTVVGKAIDYAGEWPIVGGMRGDEVSVGQLIGIGEKLRGPFTLTRLNAEDLKAGVVKSPWLPKVDHPSMTPEQQEAMGGMMVAGMLLGTDAGCWSISTEWNDIFPEYKFEKAEDFLTKVWEGKP